MRRRIVIFGLISALIVPALSAGPASGGPTAASVDTIVVQAVDYNFNGLPERIEKGQTKFRFSNGADQPHELIIVKRRNQSNKTFKQLVKMPEKEVNKHIRFIGFSWAKGGKKGKAIEAKLTPGRYFAVCFFRDDKGEPPHWKKGMLKKIDVK